MAEQLLAPYTKVLVASAVQAATGTSANITLPLADSYAFNLNVTASSAPTTLDVALQTTDDGGTTWYSVIRYAQVGAVATAQQVLILQPIQGRGEAASGIVCADTGGKQVQNMPLSTLIRFKWTIAGTSYTFAITATMQARATAV